ncbi:O-antigen ligase family protein [Paenibacillus sp. CC-CFT747]|nr:O-antigen ligase family protein [Paenibacillus sp. CC-CFT747]
MTLKNDNTPSTVPDRTSITFWLSAIATVSFIFITPFYKALFNGYSPQFELPISSAISVGSIILLIISILFIGKWSLHDQGDLLGLAVWLIPLSYYLSYLFAASPHLALIGVYIQSLYTIFFIAGLYLSRIKEGSSVIQESILYSGYLIMLFGIGNLFGNLYYKDAVMPSDGIRLTSVFQYANSYAAFLISVTICCLFKIVNSKKTQIVFFHSLVLTGTILSFFMTLSRGALVLFPAILLLSIIILPLARQLILIFYLFIGVASALIINGRITEIALEISKLVQAGTEKTVGFSSPFSIKGWLILTIASLVTALLITLFQKYVFSHLEEKLGNINKLRFAKLIIPFASVFLGLIITFLIFAETGIRSLLPTTLRDRIENINLTQHSVLERGTFYKDGYKLIKEHFFFGAGGGGWATLYEKYQNNPYTSRQAHSFFLQYWIEAGLIGLLLFLALVLFVFFKYLSSIFRDESENGYLFYIPSVTLLVHSSIDFDMSFLYLGCLLFLCLGGMASTTTLTPLLKQTGKQIGRSLGYIYPICLIISSVALFLASIITHKANSNYLIAIDKLQKQQPFQEVMDSLNQSIKLQSNNVDYLGTKANLLVQAYQQTHNKTFYEEFKKVILQAKQKEPNSRIIIESEFSMFQLNQQLTDSLYVLERALTNYPWDMSLYERSILFNNQLALKAKTSGDVESYKKYSTRSIQIYEQFKSKIAYLDTLPKEQFKGRDFFISKNVYLAVGQIYYLDNRYAEASDLLEKAATNINLDVPENRIIARWYISSLLKLNKNNESMYKELIEKDPNERQEISDLIKIN